MRNDYAHGRWGVPGKYLSDDEGRMVNAKPLLAFVPLHWNFSPEAPDMSVHFTLEEFAVQVAAVETLFSDYWALNERHRPLAKTRALKK